MIRTTLLALALFAGSCHSPSGAGRPSATTSAKGWLMIVGGGGTTDVMYERAIELGGGSNSKVVVFPQASELADTGAGSAQAWREHGAGSAVVADTKDEAAALKLVDEASVIWFPGGVQARLMKALGARLPDAIRQRFREGAVIGGTSAGAAVMSEVMITGEIEGATEEDNGLTFVRAGTVETLQGLGLVDWGVVDQHFVKRRRFHRLLSCVLEHPGLIGVGIDERTAILVHGPAFEVLGESQVIVVDPRRAKPEATPKGERAAGTDLELHLLRPGMRFEIEE